MKRTSFSRMVRRGHLNPHTPSSRHWRKPHRSYCSVIHRPPSPGETGEPEAALLSGADLAPSFWERIWGRFTSLFRRPQVAD